MRRCPDIGIIKRRFASTAFVLAVLMLGAVVTQSGVAQALGEVPLSVTASSGRSEVRLPETGWRRSVIGRPVPDGSVLTTWTASRVTVEGNGLRFGLEAISHVEVARSDERTELTLSAGTLTVQSEDTVVVLVRPRDASLRSNGFVRIEGSSVRFRVTTSTLELEEGKLTVTRPDGSTVMPEAGTAHSLLLHPPQQVF
jgi:hypothetical protein